MRGDLGLGDVKADEVPEDTVAAMAESTTIQISEDGGNEFTDVMASLFVFGPNFPCILFLNLKKLISTVLDQTAPAYYFYHGPSHRRSPPPIIPTDGDRIELDKALKRPCRITARNRAVASDRFVKVGLTT
ncbi:unnamed protein product [Lactuca saligna]|uniref:Uncharacterized protein n=1 Tax=Lactuca saligna TaxID=75948 RepID=A0AA35V2N9_LACSI|nr:unnamed protein product [Lactuca saligna]